jgi:hypothetical protein
MLQSLVTGALPVIETAMRQLQDMAAELAAIEAPPPELERFTARWRFSVTQRLRLVTLLRRWQALRTDPPWSAGLAAQPDARAVLDHLARRLEETAA